MISRFDQIAIISFREWLEMNIFKIILIYKLKYLFGLIVLLVLILVPIVCFLAYLVLLFLQYCKFGLSIQCPPIFWMFKRENYCSKHIEPLIEFLPLPLHFNTTLWFLFAIYQFRSSLMGSFFCSTTWSFTTKVWSEILCA